jgi:hypothetical protein
MLPKLSPNQVVSQPFAEMRGLLVNLRPGGIVLVGLGIEIQDLGLNAIPCLDDFGKAMRREEQPVIMAAQQTIEGGNYAENSRYFSLVPRSTHLLTLLHHTILRRASLSSEPS